MSNFTKEERKEWGDKLRAIDRPDLFKLIEAKIWWREFEPSEEFPEKSVDLLIEHMIQLYPKKYEDKRVVVKDKRVVRDKRLY